MELTNLVGAIYIPDEQSVSAFVFTHQRAIKELKSFAKQEGFSISLRPGIGYYDISDLRGENSKKVGWEVEAILRRHGFSNLAITVREGQKEHRLSTLANHEFLVLVGPSEYNAEIELFRDVPAVRVLFPRPVENDLAQQLTKMAKKGYCLLEVYKYPHPDYPLVWGMRLSPWHDIDRVGRAFYSVLTKEHGYKNVLMVERSKDD